tara:strand:- start:32 stop:472 length:441 start_codon:yes stop_codon:yes gene_type:complete
MEVKGFPNYLIYPQGKLFNKKTNNFLKGSINSDGYVLVDLFNNGKRSNKKIHRLLAEHFIENPYNLKEVDHMNRIRNDNKLTNLRWVTHSQNNQNKSVNKNNKLGIKNICYHKQKNKYQYKKTISGITVLKYFDTLEEALEFKNLL